jgi:hypothetical protein
VPCFALPGGKREHSSSSAAETGIAFIKQLRKEVAIAAIVEDRFALG